MNEEKPVRLHRGSLNPIRFHAVKYFALTEFSTVWTYTPEDRLVLGMLRNTTRFRVLPDKRPSR